MPTRHQARFAGWHTSPSDDHRRHRPHLPLSHLRQQAKREEEEEEDRSRGSVTQWRGADAAWATMWFSLLIHQCGTLMSRRWWAQGSPHECAAAWCGCYTEGFWIITLCQESIEIVTHTVKRSFSTADCEYWTFFSCYEMLKEYKKNTNHEFRVDRRSYSTEGLQMTQITWRHVDHVHSPHSSEGTLALNAKSRTFCCFVCRCARLTANGNVLMSWRFRYCIYLVIWRKQIKHGCIGVYYDYFNFY